MNAMSLCHLRRILLCFALTSLVPSTLSAASFTGTGNLNTGRSQSASVLLQDGKVLAVGGYFTSTLASAELYDPATGTWTATGSLAQVRYSHAATLLPNGKVLVTGGRFDNTVLASAELYDPATGTWTGAGTMSQVRQLHTATLLNNGKVLVTGGDQLGATTATAELYDPVTGNWSGLPDMNAARSSHTATLLANGKVLIAGGYNGIDGELQSCDVFDPGTNTWTTTGTLNGRRYTHAATRLPNGKVLAIGGSFGGAIASSELYDPNTSIWSVTGSLDSGRSDPSATLLPNGHVLVTGGTNSSSAIINSAELYDPGAGTWSGTSTMSTTRALHTAVLLPGGRVLVIGGYNTSGRLADVELYDYRSGSWSNADALDTARFFPATTLLPNGKVLAVSGTDGAVESLSSAELYDPVTDLWTATGGLTTPRHLATATLLRNGKVLIAAGYRSSTALGVTHADLYDITSGTFTPTGPLVTGRYVHSCTLLPDGKVLAVNGHSGSAILASSELYDPDTGTWTETGLRTSGTYSHTATLLPNGTVLVAGGVTNGASTAIAELYNPVTGLWSTTGSLDEARHNHAATLLPNGKVLVTGGYSTSVGGKLGSAEIYDPTSGTWSSAGTMVGSRYGHTSTLLADGSVLVAGDREGVKGCSLYDPASNTWSAAATLTTARAYGSAALLLNGKVLVIGGVDGVTALTSCELFDPGLGFDNTWRPVISTLPPTVNLGSGLALTGTGFRGVSGASGGGATDASTAYPVVQLRSLDGGQVKFLPSSATSPWSDTAFTSQNVTNFPPGHALVTVFTNGIPSVSAFTRIGPEALAPEIAVEQQPEGTDLASGFAVTDFGNKGVGSTSPAKTFKIRNIGNAPLNITDVSLFVGDTGSFARTGGEPTTIAVNGFVTFTVAFVPFSVGNKNAILKITSDDADEAEFDINLTGVGQTPARGTLAFAQALNFVNEAGGTQNILIARTGGSDGPVSVTVNSAPGTATLADYNIVSNVVINFADNQTSANVPVTILNNAASEPNENFTLTLSNPTGDAMLGTPNPATVRIIDATDSTKPTVTITAPAPNANAPEGVVTLTGTATDDKEVSDVEATLNGTPIDPIVTLDGTGKSATYTCTLTPLPGPNTLTVRSKDTRNNFSPFITRTFNYIVVRPLTVNVTGPANSGTLTSPFPGTDTTKRVGYSYTLVATPKPTFVFDGWTVNNAAGTGLTPAKLELPSITFTHQTGVILTAKFIANPFTTNIVGKFNGLVVSSLFEPNPIGTVPSNENNGLLTAAVTEKTGGVSGNVKIDGLTLPFVGVFDNSGVARFGKDRATQVILPRVGKPGLNLSLALDMDGSPHQMIGILTKVVRGEVKSHSDIIADRAHYSAGNPVQPTSLTGTSKQAYTFVFKSNPTQDPIFETSDYPQGHGYATGTLSTSGTVSLTGKLADHTIMTLSMPLAEDNTWPLFAPLYGNKGSISGHVAVNDTLANTDMTCGGLTWFRPYQTVQWYPFGWEEGIVVNLIGSKYNVPPATPPATVYPDLGAIHPTEGNAALRFNDGLLTSELESKINIAPTTNLVTRVGGAAATMKITKSSGLFTGSFTHANGTKPAFQGVIYQKVGTFRGGWGYFMTVAPKPLNYQGESGSVRVTPPSQ